MKFEQSITVNGGMSFERALRLRSATNGGKFCSTVTFSVSSINSVLHLSAFNFQFSTFNCSESAKDIEWPLQIIHNLTGGEFLQDQVGNTLGHALNIGDKITASGFYGGRLVNQTPSNTLNTAISFGHYIYGNNIALSPNDYSQGSDGLDLFAHEYGHTYQSRIMDPMYLFRIGIASAIFQGSTEDDAEWRAYQNLGIDPWDNVKDFSILPNRYKWYEFGFAPFLYPFMWMWND
jgi:hypothetical protein